MGTLGPPGRGRKRFGLGSKWVCKFASAAFFLFLFFATSLFWVGGDGSAARAVEEVYGSTSHFAHLVGTESPTREGMTARMSERSSLDQKVVPVNSHR